MQTATDFAYDPQLEREILALPAFAGGTLKFERCLSASHSTLLEYRFTSHDGLRSLFVKQQVSGSDAEGATLREHSNLSRVRALLHPSLERTVPEPLLVLPKRGILVTNKVPGVALTVMLRRYGNRLLGPFRMTHLNRAGRHVGDWLRKFQHATRAEAVTYSSDSYLTDLGLRLLELRQKGFDPGFTREILKNAALLCAPLNGKLVFAAAKHGDFIPQNILIEDDRVAVVDFEGFSEREAVYEDLGMFLGYLFVLGARAPYSPRSLDTVRRGFLVGFLGETALDQALLSIYTLKGIVRIIADGPSLPGTWLPFGTMRVLTKRLKRLALGAK